MECTAAAIDTQRRATDADAAATHLEDGTCIDHDAHALGDVHGRPIREDRSGQDAEADLVGEVIRSGFESTVSTAISNDANDISGNARRERVSNSDSRDVIERFRERTVCIGACGLVDENRLARQIDRRQSIGKLDQAFAAQSDSGSIGHRSDTQFGPGIDRVGKRACKIRSGAVRIEDNGSIADAHEWIEAELKASDSTVRAGNRHDTSIQSRISTGVKSHDTIDRSGLKPEIVDTAWDSVAIAIESDIQIARSIVDVLQRVGTIGLSTEGNPQVVATLGTSAGTRPGHRSIVFIVARRGDPDEVHTRIEVHSNQGVFAEVVIVLGDKIDVTAGQDNRRVSDISIADTCGPISLEQVNLDEAASRGVVVQSAEEFLESRFAADRRVQVDRDRIGECVDDRLGTDTAVRASDEDQ